MIADLLPGDNRGQSQVFPLFQQLVAASVGHTDAVASRTVSRARGVPVSSNSAYKNMRRPLLRDET